MSSSPEADFPIYLDYNASTPLLPEVAEAMRQVIFDSTPLGDCGNPSSGHPYGVVGKKILARAHEDVAGLLNCGPSEIVIGSGATESITHALQGAAFARRQRGKHIISAVAEHDGVLRTLYQLRDLHGFRITLLPVDSVGQVRTEDLRQALDGETILVTLMLANNESGTILRIAELAQVTKEFSKDILFHTDASQGVGKIPVDLQQEFKDVDLLTLAGHKFYGPKGVGALFVRDGVKIEHLLLGGSQEDGRRAGTENLIMQAGLGMASRIARRDMAARVKQMSELRDLLQQEILAGMQEKGKTEMVRVNGDQQSRLPNTLSISFADTLGPEILQKLEGKIAASSGSACHGGALSRVLKEMGVDPRFGHGTLRLSTGHFLTEEEVKTSAKLIVDAAVSCMS